MSLHVHVICPFRMATRRSSRHSSRVVCSPSVYKQRSVRNSARLMAISSLFFCHDLSSTIVTDIQDELVVKTIKELQLDDDDGQVVNGIIVERMLAACGLDGEAQVHYLWCWPIITVTFGTRPVARTVAAVQYSADADEDHVTAFVHRGGNWWACDDSACMRVGRTPPGLEYSRIVFRV